MTGDESLKFLEYLRRHHHLIKASANGEPQALMDALLSVREIFPVELAQQPAFRDALHHALQLLQTRGARAAIAASQ